MSDDWNFYLCRVDDQPASIFVNLGIRKLVPMRDLNTLIWLRLHMLDPRPDGLSSKEEFESLSVIEDMLCDTVGVDVTDARYVGRNTSDGCRDYYFYSSNGADTEKRLSIAMVRYGEYEFETGSRSDEDWSAYLGFLYPSPRAYQTIQNRRLLEYLERNGDLPHVEREITHWIYFSCPIKRRDFVEHVSRLGYRVVDQRDDAEGENKFSLTIGRVSAADTSTINNSVLALYDLAVEYGADYDGWETSIEKTTERG